MFLISSCSCICICVRIREGRRRIGEMGIVFCIAVYNCLSCVVLPRWLFSYLLLIGRYFIELHVTFKLVRSCCFSWRQRNIHTRSWHLTFMVSFINLSDKSDRLAFRHQIHTHVQCVLHCLLSQRKGSTVVRTVTRTLSPGQSCWITRNSRVGRHSLASLYPTRGTLPVALRSTGTVIRSCQTCRGEQ